MEKEENRWNQIILLVSTWSEGLRISLLIKAFRSGSLQPSLSSPSLSVSLCIFRRHQSLYTVIPFPAYYMSSTRQIWISSKSRQLCHFRSWSRERESRSRSLRMMFGTRWRYCIRVFNLEKMTGRLVAGSGTGGSGFWKGGTGTKPLMDGFGRFGSGLTGLVNGFFGLVSGFSSYGLVRFRIILILTGLTAGLTVGSTSGSVPSFFQKNCS